MSSHLPRGSNAFPDTEKHDTPRHHQSQRQVPLDRAHLLQTV